MQRFIQQFKARENTLWLITIFSLMFYLLIAAFASSSIQHYLKINLQQMMGASTLVSSDVLITEDVEQQLQQYSTNLVRTQQFSLTLTHKTQWQSVDVNNDGDLDIVFASKHTVQYFLQDKKGNFDKQPKKMALPIELSAPESTVESYSNTTRYAFNRFDDINADGVQDIVIEKKTYEKDISDGIQQVLVLFGQYNSNKQLSFELKRSTSITHKGELIDYGFADFNGDALKDLYFLGADLGAISVLSALWGGSFIVDINIYTLDRKKGFSKKPDVSKKTEFIVDMNQIVFGSIVHIADIDGDKRSDLLLQSDDNELAIYSGNSKRL